MGSIKTTSFLSENLELKGTLKLEGGIRIDGTIEGSIESRSTIYLGESAKVLGTIVTENLVSSGSIIGQITALETVRIKTPGHFKGEVTAGNLVIDEKVFFDGNCRLSSPKQIEPPKLNHPKPARKAIAERD
ncbi:MAG: hypothetical protein A2508_05215 [Candidatus Lambdaproteobacteria bacterium RIFOXYD12_FULL_49_8]|uniref:Cell shape determination protein CcmA n=1 Tax=Candidatus Lambdaproteobacteria bacterium RIFOXYD2_FULL_50_16 TaxID=1817772 RepID=A0A1F6GEC5_9PROT|nr:MAG: hypothetical protein A2527_01805 [Candidatus Lambdaproteobacteria bacterium RIFOXYD2_FULL_50_16]OGG97476.1 MAG: hypothetical protein A2508_05215 [Candidatus Lambdaproteobacteria bacterium RIFOXYD12_FULL_49_8]